MKSKCIIIAVFLHLFSGCGTPPPDLAPSVTCFGDSQTYGKNLERGEDYPAQLGNLTGLPVINAGISKNTTRDMLARLDADVLANPSKYVVIMGGTNDIYYGNVLFRSFHLPYQ